MAGRGRRAPDRRVPQRSLPARVLRGLLWLVLVAVLCVVAWFAEGDEATVDGPAVEERLDGDVVVERVDDVWRVLPADGAPTGTLVLYPGARVEPEAYLATMAPTVRRTGVAVVVPTMPLNVALLARGRADAVRASATDADGRPLPGPWLVGGHSLGGVAAAMFLDGEPDEPWDGLLLLASYPAGGTDLSADEDLAVLAVAGADDGLTAVQDVRDGLDRLPDDARLVEVDGLNHAGFGRYGRQVGDDPASRPEDETLDDLTDAISTWLADDLLGSDPTGEPEDDAGEDGP